MRPENAVHTVCEVGLFYLVPCVFTTPEAEAPWATRAGWVPVLGPKHTDAEHINFPQEHWHVDWRFVSDDAYSWSTYFRDRPHGHVLTNTHGPRDQVRGEPELRRLKCKRLMPDFPDVKRVYAGPSPSKWARLEIAQAFICNKLKPGNICPHRGIDLTPFAKPDGTAICPGHGLRWNLSTGELMPRHAVPAAL